MEKELIEKRKPRIIKTPPEFTPKSWGKERKRAGCYPYALNLDCKEFALIGDFVGNRCTYRVRSNELIKILLLELDFLGFDAKQVNDEYELRKGEYLIYLRRCRHTGYYHFSRRDADGEWSDKFPDELPKRIDFEDEYIPGGWDRFFEGFFFALKERDS